jgi:hypothetical protein
MCSFSSQIFSVKRLYDSDDKSIINISLVGPEGFVHFITNSPGPTGKIIIHLRGHAPEGCFAAPDTARMRRRAWSPIDPSTEQVLRSRSDGLSVFVREAFEHCRHAPIDPAPAAVARPPALPFGRSAFACSVVNRALASDAPSVYIPSRPSPWSRYSASLSESHLYGPGGSPQLQFVWNPLRSEFRPLSKTRISFG